MRSFYLVALAVHHFRCFNHTGWFSVQQTYPNQIKGSTGHQPQQLDTHLGHELIGHSFMILKANLSCSQCSLQEEPQRQLCQLCFDQSTDGLMSKREDLLALLFPFVILDKENK